MIKNFKFIIAIILLFFISSFSFSSNAEIVLNQQDFYFGTINLKENDYNGYLRIYIVEPESRYQMYNDEPYHYGFLAFAHEELLSIANVLSI